VDIVVNGKRSLGAMVVAVAMLASGCGSSTASQTSNAAVTPKASLAAGAIDCQKETITTAGSTALQPLIDAAAKKYVAACPGANITVNGGGSGTGLSQVALGAVQIGDSDVTADSKLATPDANKLVDHIVAKQGWIIVTNKDVTGVTNLTTQQHIDIWTGKVTNWSQVGGPDLPIILIFRPASSGTRSTFKRIVLGGLNETTGGQTLSEDSNGAVTTAISKTNGAMSVIGFAYYNDPANKPLLNGLQLDGVDATVANMTSGTYKLSAEGHMYTNGQPAGLTAAFLDYMMSADIQNSLIPSLSYAPVAK
jgi:phosphate transport system substrate-binding protein